MQAFKPFTLQWCSRSRTNLFFARRQFKTYRKRNPDKEIRSESAWIRVKQSIHIEDESVVSVLMNHLSADLCKTDSKTHLLEACPGRALLTEAMLRQTDCTVVALADRKSNLTRLKELQKEFGMNRLHVHSFSTSLFKHMIVDAGEGNAIGRLMRQLPSRSWTEPPVASMIVPLTPISETSFLRSLFLQIANRSAFFCNGRIIFYAFISGRELYYMTASHDEKNLNRYRYSTVLYQTLFDMQILDKFKWDCFSPAIKHKNMIRNDFDIQHIFLIRLVPNANIFQRIPLESMNNFIFFVRQSMMKRTTFIISFLEKWAPGCGPKLIKMGIPLFKCFGDLSPDQFVQLFCELQTWEEFDKLFFDSFTDDLNID